MLAYCELMMSILAVRFRLTENVRVSLTVAFHKVSLNSVFMFCALLFKSSIIREIPFDKISYTES